MKLFTNLTKLFRRLNKTFRRLNKILMSLTRLAQPVLSCRTSPKLCQPEPDQTFQEVDQSFQEGDQSFQEGDQNFSGGWPSPVKFHLRVLGELREQPFGEQGDHQIPHHSPLEKRWMFSWLSHFSLFSAHLHCLTFHLSRFSGLSPSVSRGSRWK